MFLIKKYQSRQHKTKPIQQNRKIKTKKLQKLGHDVEKDQVLRKGMHTLLIKHEWILLLEHISRLIWINVH